MSNEKNLKKFATFLPVQLIRTIKGYAALKNTHPRDVICAALVEYLDKRGFQVVVKE